MPVLAKLNGKHTADPEKGCKDHFIGGVSRSIQKNI